MKLGISQCSDVTLICSQIALGYGYHSGAAVTALMRRLELAAQRDRTLHAQLTEIRKHATRK